MQDRLGDESGVFYVTKSGEATELNPLKKTFGGDICREMQITMGLPTVVIIKTV